MQRLDIGGKRIVGRTPLRPPEVGERHHVVAIFYDRGDVLGSVAGCFPEGYAGRDLETLCRPGSPKIVLIDSPMIVHPGVGKQSDVDGVIRVMMRDADISYVLGLVTKSDYRVEDDRSGGHHPRVDDDKGVIHLDE